MNCDHIRVTIPLDQTKAAAPCMPYGARLERNVVTDATYTRRGGFGIILIRGYELAMKHMKANSRRCFGV